MSHAARAVARNLRIDHTTAEVLRAFDGAGVASILLKGPSAVRWLYEGRPRRYSDCDLLVPPPGMDDAERVLRDLGFVPDVERRRMPAWWQEHAVCWLNAEEAAMVDLHRTLPGVGVDAERLWELLSADTETMVVGGFAATVLSLPGRALHLALQAAQDGEDKGDLGRALENAGEDVWRTAARLAGQLEATAAFATGLRLVPEGERLAARLDLPTMVPVDVALRGAGAPPQALTFDRLAHATGARERIAIVRHKLLPPPTFMRHWAGPAGHGRAGLLRAYGRRLVWVAREAPAAFRAWRHARRAQRESLR